MTIVGTGIAIRTVTVITVFVGIDDAVAATRQETTCATRVSHTICVVDALITLLGELLNTVTAASTTTEVGALICIIRIPIITVFASFSEIITTNRGESDERRG